MKTLFTISFFFSIAILSAQTVISFNNPMPAAPVNCNDSWSESGVQQELVPIPPSSTCSFDYSGGDLWLFPAKLRLFLSTFSNITTIEIDLIDWCDQGCTVVNFLDSNMVVAMVSNDSINTAETIVFNNTSMINIDEMTIQSFENQLFEIRIYSSSDCDDPAQVQAWIEDGDVYIEDACNGVILTSPSGLCYRVRVDDNGGLITEAVDCP
jgi:hypothetical protein